MKQPFFLAVCMLLLLLPGRTPAYDNADCIRCHGEGSDESRLRISVADFRTSVHGEEVGCTDCHVEIEDAGHQQTGRGGKVDCGACHGKQNRHGLGSLNGPKPRCDRCHSRHAIRSPEDPRSSVHRSSLRETCSGCHPAACGKLSFFSRLPAVRVSSHSKQDFSGEYDAGNCIGCHQGSAAHGEEKRITEERCSRCHTGDSGGGSPLAGPMHPRAAPREQPAVFASALLHQIGLWVFVLAGFRFFVNRQTNRRNPRR